YELTAQAVLNLPFQPLAPLNPTLNAVVHERNDRLMPESEKINTDQPFAGAALVLNNLSQAIAATLRTASAKFMEDAVRQRDARFVSKLREAGFLFMRHTNAPEFGLKNITEPELYGPTRNPWNTNHSSGGSSGGAAAAIAAGVIPAAGASD